MKSSNGGNTSFIVRTGNWSAKVTLTQLELDITTNSYIEATTQAIESCFGNNDVDNCEILELFTEERQNYFDDSCDLTEIPDFLFGVLIACYLTKDINNKKKWKYFVISDIFANAAQPINYNDAISIEKKWECDINRLINRKKHIKRNIKKKRKT